jgi:hypothetical protein
VAFPFEALVYLLCLAVLRHCMQGEQRALNGSPDGGGSH